MLFSDYPRDSNWGKYVVLSPWAKIYDRKFLIKHNIYFLDYSIGEAVYFNLQVFSITNKIVALNYVGYNWY